MAAFSDKSFDFKGYQANRPRYPDLLYETVLQFHKGDRETVLDLGTGPGLSLFPFAYQFKHLIGSDPSEGMIGQAEQAWQAWKEDQHDKNKIQAKDAKFIQGSAENLEGIADESIDLITAAQAAHWFDPNKVWPEVYRVLKPNGSVAFWGYGTNYLPRHPSLAGAMRKFMSSTDEDMGRYWPPGRELVEDLLNGFPFPSNSSCMTKWDIDSATRIQHTLSSPGIADLAWTQGKAPEEKFRMELVRSFDDINGYFRTSSALSRYYKAHPEAKGQKPDMIDKHVEKLREAVLQERKGGAQADGLDDDHVRVAWPLGVMMIRKKT
ncbi:S-adenosyl-L-methionine-dependent methyltransferase [Meira miltonrushii]|uniref:S-adenosyl-L-methionine-dependent methyltransferase n=1 Tax=Meira miltonrushii TaxID=1280837 RepID=A0A316VD17_9BASI|nr:S-adenosyl-L-methionine-dependent methyltransferase [Meira miltonrushii]PWN35539.1 S-adenosyl-L-methionine-dependent methyltransferase [Meira miltonrushii]